MTDEEQEKGLAILLQASRDFAFEQLREDLVILPFAARARKDGEIDFICYVDENTDLSLAQVFEKTQQELAGEARDGKLLAATIVAAVQGDEFDMGEGFDTAIQIHVEAPGYSRIVLAPYRVDETDAKSGTGQLVAGALVPIEAKPVIFAN